MRSFSKILLIGLGISCFTSSIWALYFDDYIVWLRNKTPLPITAAQGIGRPVTLLPGSNLRVALVANNAAWPWRSADIVLANGLGTVGDVSIKKYICGVAQRPPFGAYNGEFEIRTTMWQPFTIEPRGEIRNPNCKPVNNWGIQERGKRPSELFLTIRE